MQPDVRRQKVKSRVESGVKHVICDSIPCTPLIACYLKKLSFGKSLILLLKEINKTISTHIQPCNKNKPLKYKVYKHVSYIQKLPCTYQKRCVVCHKRMKVQTPRENKLRYVGS
jgi:hypothetical protein